MSISVFLARPVMAALVGVTLLSSAPEMFAQGAKPSADDTLPESTLIASRGSFAVRKYAGLWYHADEKTRHPKHKLDIYRPEGLDRYPVLFFIHGGGWTMGDRSFHPNLGLAFAGEGIGVVAISYRLSPSVMHPAHIQDAAEALAWTHRTIERFGGDATRLFVSGHSAGGHLAALLSLSKTWLKPHDLDPDTAIRGTIPISGVFRVDWNTILKERIFPRDEEICRQASPVTHIRGDAPPMLVLYADKDMGQINENSRNFVQSMKDAGARIEGQELAARTHFTIITRIGQPGDGATDAIRAYIRSFDPKTSPNATPRPAPPRVAPAEEF